MIILILIFVLIGIFLESYQIIEEPAYWTLYGIIWGFLLAIRLDKPKKLVCVSNP